MANDNRQSRQSEAYPERSKLGEYGNIAGVGSPCEAYNATDDEGKPDLVGFGFWAVSSDTMRAWHAQKMGQIVPFGNAGRRQ